MRNPVPTQREPDAESISPSFIGVSTPSENKKDINTTNANAATEISAFLSFAPLDAREASDDTTVMITTIAKMTKASVIMGDTDEKLPAKPSISMTSSPLERMETWKTKANTPQTSATIFVIF